MWSGGLFHLLTAGKYLRYILKDAEKLGFNVTPAKAGVQNDLKSPDSCFRRNGKLRPERTFSSDLLTVSVCGAFHANLLALQEGITAAPQHRSTLLTLILPLGGGRGG